MKTIILILVCSALIGHGKTVKTFNEEKEKGVILKLLNTQTEISFKGDYDVVKGYYIQSNYAFRAHNSSDGTFNARVGSKEIDEYYDNAKLRYPVNQGSSNHPKVERRNFVWKFFTPELAFVIWDQYNSDKEMKMFTYSKETRLMEKQNGSWKIASLASYWDYKNQIPVESLK